MSQMCPVCRSMLTPAEITDGKCGSCEARFSPSDLGPALPPTGSLARPVAAPAWPVASLATPGQTASRPPASDNPYATPESNYVAATVVASGEAGAGSPEYEKARKEAPQLLFGLAALGGLATAVLLGIAFVGEAPDLKVQMLGLGIEAGIIATIFAGLGAWSLAQPFPASVVGLLLYVLITVAALILDPASVGRVIIVRIIIMGLLAKIVFALSKGPGHA